MIVLNVCILVLVNIIRTFRATTKKKEKKKKHENVSATNQFFIDIKNKNGKLNTIKGKCAAVL